MPQPLKATDSKRWVKAVVKTKTAFGYGYAMADNISSKPSLKRTFGKSAAIISIEEIYPYEFLESRFMPRFKNDAQIREFLRRNELPEPYIDSLLSKEGKTIEQQKADRATIDNIINDIALGIASKTLVDEEKMREHIAESKKKRETRTYGERTKGKTKNRQKKVD